MRPKNDGYLKMLNQMLSDIKHLRFLVRKVTLELESDRTPGA